MAAGSSPVANLRHLFPLRSKFGDEYAVNELRDGLELKVFRNWFLDWQVKAARSARIGITYVDTDPDRAFAIAQEIAKVMIDTSARIQREDTRAARAQLPAIHVTT